MTAEEAMAAALEAADAGSGPEWSLSPASAASILAALSAAGYVVVRREDVAECLMERDALAALNDEMAAKQYSDDMGRNDAEESL